MATNVSVQQIGAITEVDVGIMTPINDNDPNYDNDPERAFHQL